MNRSHPLDAFDRNWRFRGCLAPLLGQRRCHDSIIICSCESTPATTACKSVGRSGNDADAIVVDGSLRLH